MSRNVGGLDNTDEMETWEVGCAAQAAHFGLPWNGAGYHLVLLRNRRNGTHATLVLDDAAMTVDFRPAWPTEWPEHNRSDCAGHGHN